MIRRFRKSDLPRLREIHREAGYKFNFDHVHDAKHAYVLESEGKVVGYASAIPAAELVGMVARDWRSPHERLKAFALLHKPVAESLQRSGIKKVFSFVDRRFPKFGRRLEEMFADGWMEALDRCYFVSVGRVLKWAKGEN